MLDDKYLPSEALSNNGTEHRVQSIPRTFSLSLHSFLAEGKHIHKHIVMYTDLIL